MLGVLDGNSIYSTCGVLTNGMKDKKEVTKAVTSYIKDLLEKACINSYYLFLDDNKTSYPFTHKTHILKILLSGGTKKDNGDVHYWGAVEVDNVKSAMINVYNKHITEAHITSASIIANSDKSVNIDVDCPILVHTGTYLQEYSGIHYLDIPLKGVAGFKYITPREATNNKLVLLGDKNSVVAKSKVTKHLFQDYVDSEEAILDIINEYIIRYGEADGLKRFHVQYSKLYIHKETTEYKLIEYVK